MQSPSGKTGLRGLDLSRQSIWGYNGTDESRPRRHQKKALPILKQAGVTRSSIFGSYVRGEATKDSDIDFLVEVPRDTDLFDLADLKIKLEKALGKETDLVTYKSVDPLLKDRILAEQVRIL